MIVGEVESELLLDSGRRLKHWLKVMRGLRTGETAEVIIAGYAFMQNPRRGHDGLAVDTPPALRIAAAFTELAEAIEPRTRRRPNASADPTTQQRRIDSVQYFY